VSETPILAAARQRAAAGRDPGQNVLIGSSTLYEPRSNTLRAEGTEGSPEGNAPVAAAFSDRVAACAMPTALYAVVGVSRVTPTKADPWLTTSRVSTPNGTTADALVAVDLAHVLWAVNMGCLGFHVWPNTAADPEHADELRIDLDPGPGVTFEMIREGAAETKALLDELGVASFPKTTGNRGIHVYVRLQPKWDGYAVRAAAVAVARELERRRPDLLTAAWWKEERGSRVFVDFNQNAPHKTVFGAWSVRSNPHGQVSAPFTWDELAGLEPRELTLATVPARVAEHGDPWAAMTRESLDPLLALHERDMANGLMDAPWPPVYPKMPNEPPRVAPSRARKEE